jgi:hypothetical protein
LSPEEEKNWKVMVTQQGLTVSKREIPRIAKGIKVRFQRCFSLSLSLSPSLSFLILSVICQDYELKKKMNNVFFF